MIVADVESGIILGLDFLKNEKGHIDIETNSLILRGKKYPLNCNGRCYRIVIEEKVTVPARAEVKVPGKVSDKRILKEDLCVIEPTEKIYENGQCIAKSLVHGK